MADLDAVCYASLCVGSILRSRGFQGSGGFTISLLWRIEMRGD